MPLLIWNPAWETGVAAIDHQHRTLLGLIEKLFSTLAEHREPEDISEVLEHLHHYVDEHFSMEERLMESCNFPGKEEHKAIHQELRDQVLALLEAQALDPGAVSEQVVVFLSNWLISHIDGWDRTLAAYLRAKTRG